MVTSQPEFKKLIRCYPSIGFQATATEPQPRGIGAASRFCFAGRPWGRPTDLWIRQGVPAVSPVVKGLVAGSQSKLSQLGRGREWGVGVDDCLKNGNISGNGSGKRHDTLCHSPSNMIFTTRPQSWPDSIQGTINYRGAPPMGASVDYSQERLSPVWFPCCLKGATRLCSALF